MAPHPRGKARHFQSRLTVRVPPATCKGPSPVTHKSIHPFPHSHISPVRHLPPSALICKHIYAIGIPFCPLHRDPLPVSQLRLPSIFAVKGLSAQRGWDSCSSNRYAPSHSSPFCRPPFAPLADRAFTASKGMSTPSPSPALFQRSRQNWGFLLQKISGSPKEPPVSQFFSRWGNAEGLAAAGAGDLSLRPTHLVGPPAASPAKRRGRRWRGPEERRVVTTSPPSPPAPTAEPPAGRGFATPASRAEGQPVRRRGRPPLPPFCGDFPHRPGAPWSEQRGIPPKKTALPPFRLP